MDLGAAIKREVPDVLLWGNYLQYKSNQLKHYFEPEMNPKAILFTTMKGTSR